MFTVVGNMFGELDQPVKGKKVLEAGMNPGEHWRERLAGTGPSDRSALYEAACF